MASVSFWSYHPKLRRFGSHQARVAHFAIFESLVFAITSKILRFLMEHIEKVCSLESELFLITICSIRILDIFEVIVKNDFS